MDRDRDETRVERHGPFGVREEPPTAPSPVGEEAPGEVEPKDDSAGSTRDGAATDGSATDGVTSIGVPTEASPESSVSEAGANAGGANNSAPVSGSDLELREKIIQAMKTVYDPEIPVNIYDLGMVYEIEVRPGSDVLVTMTLTSPACPVAGTLPGEVEDKVKEVDGVETGKVELVWDPPWTPDRMSEAAKLELGMF